MSDGTGDFWGWIKNKLFTPTKQFMAWEVPLERIDPRPAGVIAAANQHYFRIRVAQMFLRHQSVLLRDFRPVVQSAVEYSFGSKRIELANVADTTRLELKADGSNFVARNFTLLPLMPFEGGTIRLAAALLGMPGTDTLKNFVDTVSKFAGMLAVPQLSAAISFAQPVADGVRALFGEAKLLRVGYLNELNGEGQAPPHLCQQYLALIAAEADVIQTAKLRVFKDQLFNGDEPFNSHDFMLLRFDIESSRDDFNQLTSIGTPFSAALDSLAAGDSDEADSRYREAIRAVIGAPELTKADRRRVATLLKEEFDAMKQQLGGAGLRAAVSEFELQTYMNQRAMPLEEARRAEEPEYDEFV
jgi:hypothetical protein